MVRGGPQAPSSPEPAQASQGPGSAHTFSRNMTTGEEPDSSSHVPAEKMEAPRPHPQVSGRRYTSRYRTGRYRTSPAHLRVTCPGGADGKACGKVAARLVPAASAADLPGTVDLTP